MNFRLGNFDAVISRDVIEEVVDERLKEARDIGKIDDIRQYPSYNHFPGNPDCIDKTEKPIEDVQYVAMDTKLEYNWVVDNSLAGGHYELINETTNEDDINQMFGNNK